MKPFFAVFASGLVWGTMACATTDDRPKTLTYVTEAILAPSCATAECHSAFKREKGYAFDRVELAQDALSGVEPNTIRLIAPCATPGTCDTNPDINDTNSSYLLTIIYDKDLSGNRMPYDAAMPDEDKQLLADWIQLGAPGFVAPEVP